MNFHELIHLIFVRRIQILKVTFISSIILFLLLYFVYPITYSSEVKLFPPEEKKASGLGALIGMQDFAGLLSSSFSVVSAQVYLQILQSRSAAEYVVKKHDLITFYDVDGLQKAVKNLQDNLSVSMSKEGIISISVDVSTPLFSRFSDNRDEIKNFAAELSNSYADALDYINMEKSTSQARRARIYIENQIKNTKTVLDSMENKVVEFQNKHKTFALNEQVKTTIESAAKIKSEMIAIEIELGYLRNNLTEDNVKIISLRKKLDELNQQYKKFEVGGENYLIAFSDVPELGKQYASLLREVKIQNEVYAFLQQQYYKEKIQENRDISTIEILDPAIPSLRHKSPRVLISLILGSIFIFLTYTLILLISEKKTYFYKK